MNRSAPFAVLRAFVLVSTGAARGEIVDGASQASAVREHLSATVRLQVDCALANGTERLAAVGSGFIVSPGGLVLTAFHVVKEAVPPGSKCRVSGFGGPLSKARRLDVIPPTPEGVRLDVTLLQLPSGSYPALPLGQSTGLLAGVDVRVVGYDLGDLAPSIHDGTITSRPAQGESESGDLIHVDPLFTSGSSGGPVSLRVCDAVVGMALGGVHDEIGAAVPGQLRVLPMSEIASALDLNRYGINVNLGPCRPWPEGLATGGRIVITKEQASAHIAYLRIPRDARVEVAPDVESVDWSVDFVSYEEGATLDVSAPPVPPSKQADGYSLRSQPRWGIDGAAGEGGVAGKTGRNGASLRLVVAHDLGTGTLWIRTDGQPGGEGGNGGDGQTGGGSSCGRLFAGEPHTNGGMGGAAGSGGAGGVGGRTSEILLRGMRVVGASCAPGCGTSSRPTDLAGGVVVFGAPGCGGPAGTGGRPGPGGDEGIVPERDCIRLMGRVLDSVRAGQSGAIAPAAAQGDAGVCSPVALGPSP